MGLNLLSVFGKATCAQQQNELLGLTKLHPSCRLPTLLFVLKAVFMFVKKKRRKRSAGFVAKKKRISLNYHEGDRSKFCGIPNPNPPAAARTARCPRRHHLRCFFVLRPSRSCTRGTRADGSLLLLLLLLVFLLFLFPSLSSFS